MSNSVHMRVSALGKWAEHLNKNNEKLSAAVAYAAMRNLWFTEEQSWSAIEAIRDQFLDPDLLSAWANAYNIKDQAKQVGLILAGNIPLVGFHDVLSVFVSGNKALIKCSEKDSELTKYMITEFCNYFPEYKDDFTFINRLKDFDAVIATGSNNTARYFESYFGKYPHIIRKNRHGIGVLDGTETKDDLRLLAKDVFNYFGLGCRNVSKIFVPKNYDLNFLLEVFHEFNSIILHPKYKNNFDYNIALFMLNREIYLNNGSIILKEDERIGSRIACLHYEYYDQLQELEKNLQGQLDKIQCVVSKTTFSKIEAFSFGESQNPGLNNYADGVDTLAFLSKI